MSIESTDSTTNQRSKTDWWTPHLAGPVITAAVIRMTLLAASLARTGTSAIIYLDTSSFIIPGRNLLLHGRFIADGAPDLVRTPGYPLFLAITSLGGLPASAVANVVLSVFSVIVVWRLGQKVFDDQRIALGAAWLFAFEPISVIMSVLLMSEALFLTLFLLSLERFAEFLHRRRLRVLAVAGLWLASATFVRPITYYLPLALAVGLFLVLARMPGLRWKAPAVLLISVMPWLAAWQIHNRVETGYSGFSSVSDINLYFDNAADVTARVEHRRWTDVRNELGYTVFANHSGQSYLFQPYLERHPEQAGWSQGQRLAFMHSQAIAVIRTHYGVYLRSCVADLFKTVINPGAKYFDPLLIPGNPLRGAGFINEGPAHGIALAKAHPWIAADRAAFGVVMLGLYLFAFYGIVLVARGVFRGSMHNASLWLLLGTSLYILAITSAGEGPFIEARLRLPVMPVVCILAAAGLRRTKIIAH